MRAVFIDQTGGAGALKCGEQPQPEAGAGQVLVKVAHSGVNFIDTYHRSGLYKLPLPAVLGSEGAGVVEAVGAEVNWFQAGDRVAWAMSRGSYAEYAVVPASLLVHVPDAVDLRTAAAAMLQGMTAHYLTHSTFFLKPEHTALVHAAAGGTGRLIVQMAAAMGARVIGTAGSEEKVRIVLGDGASAAINYKDQDFVAEVKRLTNGGGVDVVYDSVGETTFAKSLDCLKPRGLLAAFGQSSGPVGPIDPLLLSQKGSLYLTRPTLANYISKREELDWRARDLFDWIGAGTLKIRIDRAYRLEDVALAHRDLEGRKTTGKLILDV